MKKGVRDVEGGEKGESMLQASTPLWSSFFCVLQN